MNPTNYIGYHGGDVDDVYDNSSENETFNEICQKANWLEIERGNEPENYVAYVYENVYDYKTNEMRTIILGYGTKNDMYNLERDLHNKYDVAKNPKYFNDMKSGGAYKTIKVDDLEDLRKKIKNGEFTKKVKENIADLYVELIPKRLQNRTSEDAKFVRDIRDDIIAERSTEYCEPIRVKIDKDGKRRMFDGNTTLMGAYGARKKVQDGGIDVDEIPYEISKLFTDDEFNELGVLLNEKPKVTKRPCSREDVATVIWKRLMKNQTPMKDIKNKEYIEKVGHTPTLIYSIVRAWVEKGHTVGTYINYQLEHNKRKLEKVVKRYTDGNTKVLSFSSAKYRDEDVNEWLSENTNFGRKKPSKTRLRIVIYHPNIVKESYWDSTMMNKKKKEVKYLGKLTGVEFIGFKYMDTQ
jgi:hypothetical protein